MAHTELTFPTQPDNCVQMCIPGVISLFEIDLGLKCLYKRDKLLLLF